MGCWINSKALERKYYRQFVAGLAAPPLPYRRVAIALGRITQKRERQLLLARGRKRHQCNVVEYLIPAPQP